LQEPDCQRSYPDCRIFGIRSWDYFLPAYNCPLKEKVGIDRKLGDNGKWLCGVRTYLQKPNCVIYSFGSNGETTFEQDVLRKTKCKVSP
jgi:hypothetical protein